MSNSIATELTEKDQELIARHKKTAKDYAPGGKHETWSSVNQTEIGRSARIADTIISANILPQPLDPHDIPVLVSLSSNVGITEEALAEKLGPTYRVIAGDIADVERLSSQATPVQFDASFLPFKDESIAAMLDLQGSIWHEASYDQTSLEPANWNAENLLDIFARLRRSLREGGIIIVDDPGPENPPEMSRGTGIAKVDRLLEQTGKKIEGFEVSTIGQRSGRLRIYKKVSSDKML